MSAYTGEYLKNEKERIYGNNESGSEVGSMKSDK
jgi:hypothetical protein